MYILRYNYWNLCWILQQRFEQTQCILHFISANNKFEVIFSLILWEILIGWSSVLNQIMEVIAGIGFINQARRTCIPKENNAKGFLKYVTALILQCYFRKIPTLIFWNIHFGSFVQHFHIALPTQIWGGKSNSGEILTREIIQKAFEKIYECFAFTILLNIMNYYISERFQQ